MKNVIVIPGIMGTRLRKQKQTVWPWFSSVNNYPSLKYNQSDELLDPYQCFKLYYDKIQKHLKEQSFQVFTFPYDWRRNNLDQLELLKAEIDKIDGEVYIVAHSMGGIIAKLFLNYFKEDQNINLKIKKLITLGTPWHGAPYAYKAIKYGVNIPEFFPVLMNRFTSKEVAPTFPSLYQLLPSKKYLQLCENYNKEYFLEQEGLSIINWDVILQNHYNPYLVSNFGEDSYKNILEDFHDLLNVSVDVEHHEIIGYGKKTIARIKENSYLGEPSLSFDTGDHTVPVIAAMSETEQKYFICENHNGLPNNKYVQKLVSNIINEQQNPCIDLEVFSKTYEEIKDIAFTGKAIKIACPVTVSLIDEHENVVYGNIEVLDMEEFENILNTSYEVTTIENTTYIFVPEDKLDDEDSKKIIVEAYESGPTSISIEKYESGVVSHLSVFETFIISTNVSAEINLFEKLEDININIKQKQNEDIIINSITIDLNDRKQDITLPQTELNIIAEKERIIDDKNLIVSGETFLSLSVKEKSTYQIIGTYYSLNDNDYNLITLDMQHKLNLNVGRNTLKYFSEDALGHLEEKKVMYIYYYDLLYINFAFKFYPHLYELNIINDNEVIYEKLNVTRPEFKVEFTYYDKENRNEVFQEVQKYTVMYKDHIRNIKINYTDIFNVLNTIEFEVDELAVKFIIEGVADVENFMDLLSGLKLFPYEKLVIKKLKGKGQYSTISKEHIQNSKNIEVVNKNVTLEIVKGAEYIIFFQDFNQDLLINSQENYDIKFKVVDIKNKNEIRTKEFSALIRTVFNNEQFISDEIELVFDYELDCYRGVFNVRELRDFLKEFWISESLKDVDLVIQEQGSFTKEVTTEVITVR